MDNKIKLLILGLLCLSLVGIASANNLSLYVRPLSGGEVVTSTAFNYTFNFTSSADCSGVLLSKQSTITTDIYGLGFTTLSLLGLSTPPAYQCEYRDGTLRKAHTIGAGLFSDLYSSGTFYNTGGISSSSMNLSSNLNVSGNVVVNKNLTITNTVNSTYWDMYVDTNGTLVWEME